MKESIENNKFTWGDTVVVRKGAPSCFLPGEGGVVCGFSQIEYEDTQISLSLPRSDWQYTVEFSDGHSLMIPESYLELYCHKNLFDCKQTIAVKKVAPSKFFPGKKGTIISLRQTSSEEYVTYVTFQEEKEMHRTWVYKVRFEFEDKEIEIPELYLES